MYLGSSNYPGPNAYLGEGGGGGEGTVAAFNSRYASLLVAGFNAIWEEVAEDQFQTQAFGNAPGARVRHEEGYYRIESASYTPTSLSFSANMDTVVADFNEVWGEDSTVGDFNHIFDLLFVRDFNTIPLRRG